MVSPSVFIFVALTCEAKPLIRYWRLKKQIDSHPFTIYSNAQLVLVVSGPGKLAMAGAVGYAMALYRNSSWPVLLNIGIAGHKSHELGSVHLAHKIIDTESMKCFYPQCLSEGIALGKSEVLKTVNVAEHDYAGECLFDMEAAGFYEMAVKFSNCELIHCLKVISDNGISGAENIDEQKVDLWMEQSLPVCLGIVEQLTKRRSVLHFTSQNDIYTLISAKYNLTASNAVKLKAMLQRWKLLGGSQEAVEKIAEANSLKKFISGFEEAIERIDFYL